LLPEGSSSLGHLSCEFSCRRGTYKDRYDNELRRNSGTHRETPWFIGWQKRSDRALDDPMLLYHADGVREVTLIPISVTG